MHLSKVDGDLFLNHHYPKEKFILTSTGGEDSISCFVHWVSNSDSLEKYWAKVSSLIAVEYQSSLTSVFASWNIYLAFVCSTPVERSLKYRIENDRFSMRKVVIDDRDLTEDQVIHFMNNEIFCLDLELIPEVIDTTIVQPSSKFKDLVTGLGDIPLTTSDTSSKRRIEQLQALMLLNKNEN